MRIRTKDLSIHIIIWTCYVLYESSILFYIQPESIHWLEIFFSFILNAGIFYLNANFLLPQFEYGKRFWILLPAFLVLISVYILLSYLQHRYFFPWIESKDATIGSIKNFIAQRVYRATYFLALSSGYWFAKKSISSEVRLRDVEREHYLELLNQQQLKKEIAILKLASYRSQLNPHFLFNTLNFFYSNIYPYSKDLADSIVLLSNLIRRISEKSMEENFVDLPGEIELIENYLKLNQLRYENQLNIKFTVEGIAEHKKIAPFIMMTIIENAFKYGELTNKKYPLIIKLKIMATRLELYTENIITQERKGISTGIGLSNLKKQLELIYNVDYSLVTTEINNKFKCCLKLKI